MPSLEPWYLDILACPRCHEKVTLVPDGSGLVCAACRLVYPVIDDIPNFLVDEALPLEGGK